MIESNSSLGTFLTCPRKYQYSYIKLLESRGYNSPLSLGALVHALIEDVSNKGRETAAVDTYNEILARITPEQKPQLDFDLRLATVLFERWFIHWGVPDPNVGNDSLEWIESEMEWKIPLGNGRFQVGKSDGIVRHKRWGHLFLYEFKTAADRSQESYLHRLEVDRQISSNIIAAKAKGYDVHGVLYDIAWKPGIRRLTGRKTKPDETDDEFLNRYDKALQEGQSFTRKFIYRDDKQIEEHQKDLFGQYSALELATQTNNFYRNTHACDDFGRLCPYFSLCMEGAEELESLYRKRDRKLPELSKETQSGNS